jgi:hypothetical protein
MWYLQYPDNDDLWSYGERYARLAKTNVFGTPLTLIRIVKLL